MPQHDLRPSFVAERDAKCECGREFTQHLLSPDWLAMVERRGERCYRNFTAQIPAGWVPVHCPSCERRDLAHRARLDDMQPHHTERNEAAD